MFGREKKEEDVSSLSRHNSFSSTCNRLAIRGNILIGRQSKKRQGICPIVLWKGANWTLLKTQSGELLGCKLAEYNAGVCAFVNYLVGVSDSGEGHSKMLAWSK